MSINFTFMPTASSARNRGFHKVDYSGIDARNVLEQN